MSRKERNEEKKPLYFNKEDDCIKADYIQYTRTFCMSLSLCFAFGHGLVLARLCSATCESSQRLVLWTRLDPDLLSWTTRLPSVTMNFRFCLPVGDSACSALVHLTRLSVTSCVFAHYPFLVFIWRVNKAVVFMLHLVPTSDPDIASDCKYLHEK